MLFTYLLIFRASFNFPASRSLLTSNISFGSPSNMNGFVNSTTPFKNVNWLRTDLNFKTTG